MWKYIYLSSEVRGLPFPPTLAIYKIFCALKLGEWLQKAFFSPLTSILEEKIMLNPL